MFSKTLHISNEGYIPAVPACMLDDHSIVVQKSGLISASLVALSLSAHNPYSSGHCLNNVLIYKSNHGEL